jgi:RHS repeat-associated protein
MSGRLIHDRVTTLGSSVDDTVLRISTSFDIRGLRDALTSYDNATVGSGNAVNEVVFEYDDMGNLLKEYQEHEGGKDANTLYVQYNRDTAASSGLYTNRLRLASVRYPNGRLLHTTYGTSGEIGDLLDRAASLNADNSGSPGDAIAEYSYLGHGTIVKEDYPQPDVRLDYDTGTAGEYAGLDRFGRIVDQLWYDYGANTSRDQYTYGYDRASNRLYRENTSAGGKDEFYSFDEVDRLVALDRGDLNAGKDAITGTIADEEDWLLDMTGNWTEYVQKTSGTTNLDQERTHNEVNEVSAVTATIGANWSDPVHDRNGNMTSIPKPSSLTNGLSASYDAWNRLVKVTDGETVVGQYEYDAWNRRIKRCVDSESPSNPDGLDTYIHYHYNSQWQILETRETATESSPPESLQPKYQYVWSERQVDSAILRDENTDADGLCDDERVYYLNDANFNVTTLVDNGGDAVERYLYSPYGNVTIYDATWSSTRSTSNYDNMTLYAGREHDSESGFCQYRNRYFHAGLGRFASRDPIAYDAGSVNLYEYVGSRPTVSLDPLGLKNICHMYLFAGHVNWAETQIEKLYPDDKLDCSVTAVGVMCCWSKQLCAKYPDLPLLPGLPLDPDKITVVTGVEKFLAAVENANKLAPTMCPGEDNAQKKCGKECEVISIISKCDADFKKHLIVKVGKAKAKKLCDTHAAYDCDTKKWSNEK